MKPSEKDLKWAQESLRATEELKDRTCGRSRNGCDIQSSFSSEYMDCHKKVSLTAL